MTTLLTTLLTSLALSFFALVVSHLLGSKNPGKSSLFTAGMIVLLMLLPLTQCLPKLQITLHWFAQNHQQVSNSTANSFSLYDILILVWLTGLALLLMRLGLHYFSVRQWRRSAERCTSPEWTHRLHELCGQLQMESIPPIGISDKISSPVVTGLIYPQILLPRSSDNWSEDTMNHVLLHELGHVKRRDLWISVASHITCAIHWFNPLVWKLCKKQSSQCEFACDSYVLSSGANAKSYIHALCDVAEQASNKPSTTLVLAMANKASLKQRVELLLQEQKPSGRLAIITLLSLCFSVTLAANVIEPQFTPKLKELENEKQEDKRDYTDKEIEDRMTADPFPAEKEE